jgi:hypothetical protein
LAREWGFPSKSNECAAAKKRFETGLLFASAAMAMSSGSSATFFASRE